MKTSLLILLIVASQAAFAQDLRIYHGFQGNSGIIVDNNTVKSQTLYAKKGSTVVLEIINSHPDLYRYSFDDTEVELEEDIPDFSDIIPILTDQLSAGRKEMLFEIAVVSTWQTSYQNDIKGIETEIRKMDSIIATSDYPQSLDDAIYHRSTSGFNYVKHMLSLYSLFTESDLNKYLDAIKTRHRSQSGGYDPTDAAQERLIKIYDTYLDGLKSQLIKIRTTYAGNKSGTVRYNVEVGDKKRLIKLLVKAKGNKASQRAQSDSLVVITVIPKYNRPTVDLTPIALLRQSNNAVRYSLSDGQIIESEEDKFNFNAGASINLNVTTWGRRDEYSLSTGLGFVVSNSNFDNFFANVSINYLEWFRIGAGYGFFNAPTGLKNGLKPGDALTNTDDLSDLISYTREPAFFITFVIPGLNLPLSK